MPDIKTTRRRFTVVAAVLICIDLLALGVLLSPIGRASFSGQRQAAQQQFNESMKELQARNRQMSPGRNIDEKIAETRQQVTAFYSDRLPGSYSFIAERLGSVANANGVKIASTHYRPEASELPGLQRVQINTAITAEYSQAVKFINALERDRLFFIIDGVSLAKSEGGMVQLNLEIETYLKSA